MRPHRKSQIARLIFNISMMLAACTLLSCTSARAPKIARVSRDMPVKATSQILSIRSSRDLREITPAEKYFGPKTMPEFELKSPTDVAVDKRGSLYISDTGLGGMAVSTAMAREQKRPAYSFSLIKTDPYGRGRPEGMGYSAELDWLVVADSYLKEVLIYELPSMRLRGSIKSPEIMNPVDAAIDASARRIYVADSVRDTVLAFDLEGNHVMNIGRPGREKGGIFGPSSVSVRADGLVYVVDSFNFRYQAFTTGGQQTQEAGEHGAGEGKFSKPHGITMAPGGRVMVSDYGTGIIQSFSDSGDSAAMVEIEGLATPAGIFADESGLLYIAEPSGHRVRVFRLGRPRSEN